MILVVQMQLVAQLCAGVVAADDDQLLRMTYPKIAQQSNWDLTCQEEIGNQGMWWWRRQSCWLVRMTVVGRLVLLL